MAKLIMFNNSKHAAFVSCKKIGLLFISTFIGFGYNPIQAQKIEGTFNRKENKFIVKEFANYISTYVVKSEGFNGYSLVLNTSDRALIVIDSLGNRVENLNQYNLRSTKLIASRHGTYLIGKRNFKWELKKVNDTLSLSHDKQFIFLTDTNDGTYFLKRIWNVKSDAFNIIKIDSNNNVTYVRYENDANFFISPKLIVERFVNDQSLSSDKLEFEYYFPGGLMLVKTYNGRIEIRDRQLNQKFTGLEIVEAYESNPVALITKLSGFNVPYAFSIVLKTDSILKTDSFDSYKTLRWHDYKYNLIVFSKVGKKGAYLINSYYSQTKCKYVYIPPKYDQIKVGDIPKSSKSDAGQVKENFNSNNPLVLYKNDTVWAFNKKCIKSMECSMINQSNFSSVGKFDSKNKLSLIGNNGSYYEKRKEKFRIGLFDFTEPAFIAGANFNTQKYINTQNSDTFGVNSISLEGGFGLYDAMANDIVLGIQSWEHAGLHLGFEYKLSNISNKSFLEKTGFKRRPLMLNLRAEGGLGLAIFGVHGQLGYSTNFNEHFIRPGIGYSLMNLQFGIDGLMPLNKDIFRYPYLGYYARWIFTSFDD